MGTRRFLANASGRWADGRAHDSFADFDTEAAAVAWAIDYALSRFELGGTWTVEVVDLEKEEPDLPESKFLITVEDGKITGVDGYRPEYGEDPNPNGIAIGAPLAAVRGAE